MNRICIAALMTVMICGSGCGRTPEEATKLLVRPVGLGNPDGYVPSLISEGADVNAKDYDGRTPLMRAVSWSFNEPFPAVRALIEAGADVNAKDERGMTAIFMCNKYEVFDVLIEAGADVNVKNKEGETPLHWEVRGGRPQVGKLIQLGAEANAKDLYGRTPLHSMVGNTYRDESGSYWNREYYRYVDDTLKRLIQAGADVNAKDDHGTTPLMHAARYSTELRMVTLLIEAGADVNAKDEFGNTPLMLAGKRLYHSPYGKIYYPAEIITILKAAGAKE